MPKLTEDEYRATMAAHPIVVTEDEEPAVDPWPYFDEIPAEDFGGHDFSEGEVPLAWNMPGLPYQHALVSCETENVFLVLVLNKDEKTVTGHYLLDLNEVLQA
jgi:hypothetical protein